MSKKNIILFSAITMILIISGCSRNNDKQIPESSRLKIFTSILPQKYFVERIGGDNVDVSVLVQPGKSPATYEPTPSQVIELSSADIFFSIGVPFEKGFLESIRESLDEIYMKDVSDRVNKREIVKHSHDEEEDHIEGHEDEHDQDEDEHEHGGGKDPHIWLSVNASKIMAENIYLSLSDKDPENREYYRENYNKLISELDKSGADIAEMLAPYKGMRFFVFHPSFGYFADDYGLEQVAIESGGKEPSPAYLEKIISEAKEEGVKVIIAQPEFSRKSAEVIADAIDGEVLLLNPLDPDYFNTLKSIAEGIERAFRK